MKNKISSSLLVVSIIGISIFIFVAYQNNFKIDQDNIKKETVTKNRDNNFISMMLETAEGSGEYTVSTDEEWPKEGYVFNSELSKCQNGSTLTYDAENNQVIIQGNKSDRCYVYFDVASGSTDGSLATYIKSLYTEDGTNGLYYHDGTGTYGTSEAGDNSYRYTGADPANYVCFGSTADSCPTENLYRIIGVFGDQVKLIKADLTTTTHLGSTTVANASYATSNWSSTYKGSMSTVALHYWSGSSSNSSNAWTSSTLSASALNSAYISYLGSTWTDKIASIDWKVGGNTWANIGEQNAKTAYENEIVSPAESTTYSAKIGLMYVSDYMYAADPTKWSLLGYSSSGGESYDYRAAHASNWMSLGGYEWTISRSSDDTNNAFYVAGAGNVNYNYVGNVYYGVRPVFYLTSSTAYDGGSGTDGDPYRVN